MIVIIWGSQLLEMSTFSQGLTSSYAINQGMSCLSPHCYVIVIVIVIVFVIVILFVFVSLVAPVPEKILPLSSFTYFHEDHNTIYRNHSLVPKLSVAAKILVDWYDWISCVIVNEEFSVGMNDTAHITWLSTEVIHWSQADWVLCYRCVSESGILNEIWYNRNGGLIRIQNHAKRIMKIHNTVIHSFAPHRSCLCSCFLVGQVISRRHDLSTKKQEQRQLQSLWSNVTMLHIELSASLLTAKKKGRKKGKIETVGHYNQCNPVLLSI